MICRRKIKEVFISKRLEIACVKNHQIKERLKIKSASWIDISAKGKINFSRQNR
jgi:hypothetical protein